MAKNFNFELKSFDTLIGTDTPSVISVPIDKLQTFKNHPFKVLDDDKMTELVESIKENGVLTPAIVRETAAGYELISGHRRKHACELAGIKEMPVIVQDLTDDEATVIMVDSNIQREELLPSEKAFAYKMKLEATKRKAGRPTKNSAQASQNKTSVELLSEETGESRATVQRLIRLTNLRSELLDMVDNKGLPVNVGVELSYLSQKGQEIVSSTIDDLEITPSIAQAKQFREYEGKGELTCGVADVILKAKNAEDKPVSVKIDKKLFPKDYSKKEMSELISKLLKEYFEEG